MSHVAYQVVENFEKVLGEYTGARYVATVDSCSSAVFLCLKYLRASNMDITIPARTFMSIPCYIVHSGNRVKFDNNHPAIKGKKLVGKYQLAPLPIWDCALSFTKDMYMPGQFMCLSFSGAVKHLKLSKGGAILTDNKEAYEWFKMARYMGRHELPHTADVFEMAGWNFYLLPELAARGLVLMMGMEENEDLEIEYQDLSNYEIYTNPGDKQ